MVKYVKRLSISSNLSSKEQLLIKSYGNFDYNISTIDENVSFKKIKHIIVLIKSIHFYDDDATAILIDPYSSIKANIHHKVFEKYHHGQIAIGTVLILKDISIFNPSNYDYYLNITLSNIFKIYNSEAQSAGGISPSVG